MNLYRRKLINVVLYFAQETRHLNLTKLMKLLNFFEFEHFRKAGYPSIGLEYYTFEHGPVPRAFWAEVKDGEAPADLSEKVALLPKPDKYDKTKREVEFRPKDRAAVDLGVFSSTERDILEGLAFIFRDATAKEMTDISHEAERPWKITMETRGKNQVIDYRLALDETSPVSPDEAEENLREHLAILRAFGLKAAK